MVQEEEYNEVPLNDVLDKKSPDALVEDKKDDVICLKPKMNLLNGVTVIVGSIIGSGIFVSPKGVLQNTGSVGMSLMVWIISGVFSLIGSYCYAELGCMITKSGADYAYIMESFGPFIGFMRLWVECMIVRPCSQAIVAMTFSFYVLRPIYPDCQPPADAILYLSLICIGMIFYLSFICIGMISYLSFICIGMIFYLFLICIGMISYLSLICIGMIFLRLRHFLLQSGLSFHPSILFFSFRRKASQHLLVNVGMVSSFFDSPT